LPDFTGTEYQMETPDLFRAHLETNHSASFAWALSCCGYNHAEAEDVLQTVYLKVLEGRAVYHGRAAFRTWLFAVIRNTAASRRRWNAFRRLRLVPLDEGAHDCVSRSDPAEPVYRSEWSARLRSALGLLPRRQREVLHLVFYQDLTVADAARVVGVSVGSARTHYERGKTRLRQLMETK
jgi:RNA polymerase sigma-70 factor (ECF subfamily)